MVRKLTSARSEALKLADKFDGLPDGLNRFELVDALEMSRAHFGLSDAELLYLRFAVRNTDPADWKPGCEPIHGWDQVDAARVLGRMDRTIRRIEESLVQKGFIVHRDGRLMRRYRSSQSAAGISLAPMGARAREILAARHQALEEHRTWRQHRIRLFELKNAIIGAVQGLSLSGGVLERIEAFLASVPARIDPGARLDDLVRLCRTAQEIIKVLGDISEGTSMSCTPDENVRPSYSSNTKSSKSTTSVQEMARIAPPEYRTAVAISDHPVPQERARIAAEIFGQMLGIDPQITRRVIQGMGFSDALKSLFLLKHHLEAATPRAEPIRNPVAYLLGMMRKHISGTLNLQKSLDFYCKSEICVEDLNVEFYDLAKAVSPKGIYG